jgi:predicted ATPase
MIERISIKNFKSHVDTTIELGKVTALVGPNGCGKTSVLQAVFALNQLVKLAATHAELAWPAIHQFTRKGCDSDSICISVSGLNNSWGAAVYGSTFTEIHEEHDTYSELFKLFGEVIYFRGVASQISLPSSTLEIPPRLNQDGSGLASVLVNLMTSDRKRREHVELSLSSIVPTVKEINARTVTLKQKAKKVFAVNGAQFA